MTAKENIDRLREHLKTNPWNRDPRESDALMGWAMLNLEQARTLAKETLLPSQYTPPGVVDLRQRALLEKFLKETS